MQVAQRARGVVAGRGVEWGVVQLAMRLEVSCARGDAGLGWRVMPLILAHRHVYGGMLCMYACAACVLTLRCEGAPGRVIAIGHDTRPLLERQKVEQRSRDAAVQVPVPAHGAQSQQCAEGRCTVWAVHFV